LPRISILNFKGGTGKTTLSINLADALARQGKRMLLIDTDLQRNTSSIIPEEQRGQTTLTQVLKGEAHFADAIYPARTNLDVLPSDNELDTTSNHIVATGPRAYYLLRNDIKKAEASYDYIIFDHSPSYSPVTESALLASDQMLIPCELAPFAVTGLLEMINKLTETLGGLDHEVSIAGIVPFKLDQRYTMTERYLTSLQKKFGELIIHPVRTDATFSRAQSVKETIYEYDPRSKAAEDITTIANLLLGREAA
jgi:chromosome partitioning protein